MFSMDNEMRYACGTRMGNLRIHKKCWFVSLKVRYSLEGLGMSRSAVVKQILGNWE